jgi:hypothetical protein
MIDDRLVYRWMNCGQMDGWMDRWMVGRYCPYSYCVPGLELNTLNVLFSFYTYNEIVKKVVCILQIEK